MPEQKLRLTEAEAREYRARLSRLEKMGIAVGCVSDPPHEPTRLILEQIDHELAKICELPRARLQFLWLPS